MRREKIAAICALLLPEEMRSAKPLICVPAMIPTTKLARQKTPTFLQNSEKIPRSWLALFVGTLGMLFVKLGLIDTSMPFPMVSLMVAWLSVWGRFDKKVALKG